MKKWEWAFSLFVKMPSAYLDLIPNYTSQFQQPANADPNSMMTQVIMFLTYMCETWIATSTLALDPAPGLIYASIMRSKQ